MLPIAASVGRITTRRLGSIWATMVSGVLAHKSKKEQPKLLFFARHFPSSTIGRSRLRRVFFWPPQFAGLERTDMNRWLLRTSGYGTYRTWANQRMSASRQERSVKNGHSIELSTYFIAITFRSPLSDVAGVLSEDPPCDRMFPGNRLLSRRLARILTRLVVSPSPLCRKVLNSSLS